MHLPSKSKRAQTSIITLMISLTVCLSVWAGEKIWTADSMSRVGITEKAPNSTTKTATIRACRNEWESTQVIITGTVNRLTSLTYRLGEFRSSSASRLPAPDVYQQYDVRIKKSSPQAPLPAGLYPDALVPLSPNESPTKASFQGKQGMVNLRLWLDFHVPSNVQPGEYIGKVTVLEKSTGRVVDTVSIKVLVAAETLPDKPTLKSFFGLEEHRIAKIHGLDRENDGVALAEVMVDYYQLLIDSRIQPGLIYASSPPLDSNNQLVWNSPASDTMPAAADIVRKYFQRNGGLNCLHLPMWRDYPFAQPLGRDRNKTIAYLAELARLSHQTAPDTQLFFSIGRLDEPETAEAYALIRKWASLVHEAAAIAKTPIKFFVTEQPQPQKAEWGSLAGSVDIWAPQVMWAWEDLESKTGRREITNRIKAGDEVWCYTALAQFRDQWKLENPNTNMMTDSYPPVWLTDYPAVNYRILPWICAAHGFTGIHYWNTFEWPEDVDPWSDAGSFIIDDETFNGDGLLIYPSAPARLVGAKKAATMKPCASIRLKWIRDGMEDYEHLQLLKKSDQTAAQQILTSIARGFADWETSPKKIEQSRTKITHTINQTNKTTLNSHPPP